MVVGGYGKMSPATVSGSDELNDGHLPAHSSHPRAPKPEKKKKKKKKRKNKTPSKSVAYSLAKNQYILAQSANVFAR